jgi:hypothetical protein
MKIAPMIEFLQPLLAQAEPLERMLALEQRFFLADHNLIYTDKMSMAVGVEVRVLFLDRDLVNFAARVPVTYKQRGPVGKWVLKKTMEPYLPQDVIYRPKSSFGTPLRRWMRYDLRELLGDLLSAESLKRRGLFEPVAVQLRAACSVHGVMALIGSVGRAGKARRGGRLRLLRAACGVYCVQRGVAQRGHWGISVAGKFLRNMRGTSALGKPGRPNRPNRP